MEHTMRRKDRELSAERATEILQKGEYGILATVDTAGQPYGVPVNYVYHEGGIYFHCAQADGAKDRNLRANPRVSFTVIGRAELIADKITESYESAIAFGRAEIVEGEERSAALLALVERLAPSYLKANPVEAVTHCAHARVYKIVIDNITGKANPMKP